MLATVHRALHFIRFSHTVFALPFALAALLLATGGQPSLPLLALVLVCLVCARTSAMAFNRWVDWDYDCDNPRTQDRHTLVGRSVAWCLIWIPIGLFIAATWHINLLCFMLAPVAILMIFGYSLTKRFTAYTHFFLGLALAAAPMGAWAAATGDLRAWPPWIIAAAVWMWVAGFDLIYATQDAEFDRKVGLHSIPARFGNDAAIRLAGVLHLLTWVTLAYLGAVCAFGLLYWTAWFIIGAALIYEHRLARTGDLALINAAFFKANAVVSLVLLAAIAGEVWTR